ncbi:PREDICTED: uncharacterized protein LOC109224607 [Nicotiana attenuata]|uniref:uncharacterized protein LOC109224607 n=1 Tax=Nicotiana attenuata TaxID=49451 RepID=UPI00090565CE|nr:PREDICTED: uncharacterized protein LOC109224607 [Nicotiana attenuata]
MISNIAKSMISANKSARDLPVTPLLDFMINLIKDWNYSNKKLATEIFIKVGQKYEDTLEENFISARKMMVKSSNNLFYTVYDGGSRYVVSMEERKCKGFLLDEFPCPHSLAIIKKFNMEPCQYYSVYYKKEYLITTYEESVHHIPNKTT